MVFSQNLFLFQRFRMRCFHSISEYPNFCNTMYCIICNIEHKAIELTRKNILTLQFILQEAQEKLENLHQFVQKGVSNFCKMAEKSSLWFKVKSITSRILYTAVRYLTILSVKTLIKDSYYLLVCSFINCLSLRAHLFLDNFALRLYPGDSSQVPKYLTSLTFNYCWNIIKI